MYTPKKKKHFKGLKKPSQIHNNTDSEIVHQDPYAVCICQAQTRPRILQALSRAAGRVLERVQGRMFVLHSPSDQDQGTGRLGRGGGSPSALVIVMNHLFVILRGSSWWGVRYCISSKNLSNFRGVMPYANSKKKKRSSGGSSLQSIAITDGIGLDTLPQPLQHRPPFPDVARCLHM